jgi:A/G-specific adenine glycosylase
MKSVIAIDKKEFSNKLLEWWSENKQDFPWRNTRDPYLILLAELLLRKTSSRQVKKMYCEFIEKYPTPKQLFFAHEDDLRRLLTGLGMENIRTKLMKKVADAILKDFHGKIPETEEELTMLPGVGRYSANAVLCTAYGADVPMLDTNAIRVIQRVFSFSTSRARAKDDSELWSFMKTLIPRDQGRNFNLGLIDFAHGICTPRNPHCCECPLKAICNYGLSHVC